MRRQALQGAPSGSQPAPLPSEVNFHGEWGALTASGDVIVESRAWRERLFNQRADAPRGTYPPTLTRLSDRLQGIMFPGGMGGMGGGLALNQLLVQMDGVDDPPFLRKFLTNRINTFLDAVYVVPQRIGNMRLRLRPPDGHQGDRDRDDCAGHQQHQNDAAAAPRRLVGGERLS